jgi:hypothetical protein
MLRFVMVSVAFAYCFTYCHYAEYGYAECHYAECHYAECRGAVLGYRFCTECPFGGFFCQMLLRLNPSKLFEPKLLGFCIKMTGKNTSLWPVL